MSTQWIQGVCSVAAACLCSYSVYQAAVQMLSLAVVRLKWLTDVRRSAWYLLLFNQTTHSNKGGGGKQDTAIGLACAKPSIAGDL